ncbi:hypothetical protein T08_10693 [Trichinella sp. T8]|nr:hypothetical protein T08_10693 [Trichinella sp. T8]
MEQIFSGADYAHANERIITCESSENPFSTNKKENKIPLLITEFIVIFMITTYFHTESLTA